MKFKLLIAFALVSVLTSCSSDGDSNSSGTTNYLPLETGNFWTYDLDGTNGIGRDSLYISNDTVISGNTYKKFKTKDQPIGFYSNSLNKNGLRKVGDELLASGTVGLNISADFPININLTDFVVFKESASVNEILGTTSGVIQQTIQGYPLTINYTLTTKSGQTISNFSSPNGDSYTDVKSVITTLNATITTTNPAIPFPITVLPAQDVIVSTQFYAKNIGVAHTNTVTSYSINQTVATELGIPASGTQTQQEFLDTYQVD